MSGGGYTGGWLSAWLAHAHADGQTPDQVFGVLAGNAGSILEPEAEPIRRIREYSNYLDPKTGLLSVDVWSLISTVARNLLLNWLVLVPLLAAALLLPRLYYAMTMLGTQDWIDRDDLFWWSTWLVLVGSGLLTVSLAYVALDLPSVGNRQRGQSAFIQLCFLPLVVATAAFTLYWAWSRALNADSVSLRWLSAIGASVHAAIWILVGFMSPRRFRPMTWLAAALVGALTGAGVWWFAVHVFAKPLARGELFAGLSVPLILAIIGGTGSLFVGIASSETTEDDREWWSRFGGWLLITIFGWLAASLVVFVGPVVAMRAVAWIGDEAVEPDARKPGGRRDHRVDRGGGGPDRAGNEERPEERGDVAARFVCTRGAHVRADAAHGRGLGQRLAAPAGSNRCTSFRSISTPKARASRDDSAFGGTAGWRHGDGAGRRREQVLAARHVSQSADSRVPRRVAVGGVPKSQPVHRLRLEGQRVPEGAGGHSTADSHRQHGVESGGRQPPRVAGAQGRILHRQPVCRRHADARVPIDRRVRRSGRHVARNGDHDLGRGGESEHGLPLVARS